MTLEITYEVGDEELSMVLDDYEVLKVSLGGKNDLILNQAFKDLENENEDIYLMLRKIAKELFKLTVN
jgi:hypothetical protein